MSSVGLWPICLASEPSASLVFELKRLIELETRCIEMGMRYIGIEFNSDGMGCVRSERALAAASSSVTGGNGESPSRRHLRIPSHPYGCCIMQQRISGQPDDSCDTYGNACGAICSPCWLAAQTNAHTPFPRARGPARAEHLARTAAHTSPPAHQCRTSKGALCLCASMSECE